MIRCFYEHRGFGYFKCPKCGKDYIGYGANDTPPLTQCKSK